MSGRFWRVALPLTVGALLVLAAVLVWGCSTFQPLPVQVSVNGVVLHELLDLHAPTAAHQLTLVVGLAAVLLLVLVLLPLLLLLTVLCVALPLGFALAIGLLVPALVVALLTALFLGPPLLLGWLLWRLLRRRPRPAAPSTITA